MPVMFLLTTLFLAALWDAARRKDLHAELCGSNVQKKLQLASSSSTRSSTSCIMHNTAV
jgi:hypothetical protein